MLNLTAYLPLLFSFFFRSGKLLTFGRGDSGQLGSSQASTKSAGDFSGKPVRSIQNIYGL